MPRAPPSMKLKKEKSKSKTSGAYNPQQDRLELNERNYLWRWVKKHGLSATFAQKLFLALKMTEPNHRKFSKMHYWFINEKKRTDRRYMTVKGTHQDDPEDERIMRMCLAEEEVLQTLPKRLKDKLDNDDFDGIVKLLRFRADHWKEHYRRVAGTSSDGCTAQ